MFRTSRTASRGRAARTRMGEWRLPPAERRAERDAESQMRRQRDNMARATSRAAALEAERRRGAARENRYTAAERYPGDVRPTAVTAARNRRVSRLALVLVLVCAVATGCGSGRTAHDGAVKRSTRPALGGVSGNGRLVDIGHGRSLFLDCMGSGSPTIVLEAGLGGSTHNWDAVQSSLAETARTCAYDRAGSGNSVAAPGVRNATEQIDDLEQLLAAAKIQPPYVLVGHSYGGVLTQLFAQAHPHDVAGIVLVDSVGRDQLRRTKAVWPRSASPQLRRDVTAPVSDNVDLAAGEALAARIRTLGQTPLIVVTAGSETFGGAPPRLARVLDRLWMTMQDELAALSRDHVHVIALRSDHFVQAPDGQPGVVTQAVRAVVVAARGRDALPACARIFHAAGVRCRD